MPTRAGAPLRRDTEYARAVAPERRSCNTIDASIRGTPHAPLAQAHRLAASAPDPSSSCLPSGGCCAAACPSSTANSPCPACPRRSTIQRDALGVVTIDAANETDAMRALGYVHCAGTLFRDGPDAPHGCRRAVGAVRRRSRWIPTSEQRVHRMRARVDRQPRRRRRRQHAAAAGLYRRRQRRPATRCSVRPWPYLLLASRRSRGRRRIPR